MAFLARTPVPRRLLTPLAALAVPNLPPGRPLFCYHAEMDRRKFLAAISCIPGLGFLAYKPALNRTAGEQLRRIGQLAVERNAPPRYETANIGFIGGVFALRYQGSPSASATECGAPTDDHRWCITWGEGGEWDHWGRTPEEAMGSLLDDLAQG